MPKLVQLAAVCAVGVVAVTLATGSHVRAQTSGNPYRVVSGWEKLKDRKIGVAGGFAMDPDGKHLWVLDRCGGNGCGDHPDVDPVIQMNLDGTMVKSFGKGLLGFPHGFAVDQEGNVWVTEGGPAGDPRGEAGWKRGLGHQVLKFSPDGKVLMRLGTANVAGADETHFNGPTGVAISPINGDIWITDGHGGPQRGPNKENMFGSRGGNNRLVRFSKDGKFIKAWGGGVGSESHDPMRFNDPHGLAIDSEGRVYVADRGNIRVQVIDKDGNFITQWTQFGKPSAVFVDTRNQLYVADGMSNDHWNPGWEKGVRVADIKTGWVKAFIPDTDASSGGNGGAGTEFIGVDPNGRVFTGGSGRAGMTVNELMRPLF